MLTSEENKNDVPRPQHYLKLINDTDRKLKLEWKGDIDESNVMVPSELNPSEADEKNSKKTSDASFIVDIYRWKDNSYIYSGQLTEHVHGRVYSSEETYYLTLRSFSDKNQIHLIKKSEVDETEHTIINTFSEDEW
ncbi:hypothetical protein ABE322_27990 [Priestia megaterium]